MESAAEDEYVGWLNGQLQFRKELCEFMFYIVQDFPSGSANVPVKAGQLLGYQGRWSEQTQAMVTTWVHLRFSVVRAANGGSFLDEVEPESVLDPPPYLGIVLKAGRGYNGWQSLRCKETSP